jgi:hypothetical protein
MKNKSILIITCIAAIIFISCSNNRTHEPYFKMAIAGLLRHDSISQVAEDIARFKQKGYTGVWFENDFLKDNYTEGSAIEWGGNWIILNLFDFTLSKNKEKYGRYLNQLSEECRKNGLKLYASFWIPQVNDEFLEYLKKNHPEAIGKALGWSGEELKTLCTCKDGKGLAIIASMVKQFMHDFPQVGGLKVATVDCGAFICDDVCPYAHGTNRFNHIGNMYECVQSAMREVRPDADFFLYIWFWENHPEEVIPRLKEPYYVLGKMEKGSVCSFNGHSGDSIFDASMMSEKAGKYFLDYVKRFGPDRLVDMTPVGTSIDDFFLAAPPDPGRLYRHFKTLEGLGVRRFFDFECGGHNAGSREETVSLYNQQPELNEDDFLKELSKTMYKNPKAQSAAVKGWKTFDEGFSHLPIGMPNTGISAFSGRFGFAWSMCITTPIIKEILLSPEKSNNTHWFSPYVFFNPKTADSLLMEFQKVLDKWQEAASDLTLADITEGQTSFSHREAVSALAHVLSVQSAINWCNAVILAKNNDDKKYPDLMKKEIELTKNFELFVKENPWVWGNNCWHPHHTPLSQNGLGTGTVKYRNAFEAKIEVMEKSLK